MLRSLSLWLYRWNLICGLLQEGGKLGAWLEGMTICGIGFIDQRSS